MEVGGLLLVKSGLVWSHYCWSVGWYACLLVSLIWLALFVYGHAPVSGETNTNDQPSCRERTLSCEQVVKAEPEAFMSDELIANSLFYRTVQLITYRFCCWFHKLDYQGLENLPPAGTGALLVSIHSTHNQDILTGLTGIQARTSRVPRGLIHRGVAAVHPYLKYMGMVAGHRNTAKHLLKNGNLTCVLPGGAEEAVTGHENAYGCHPRWKDRRGFAHVAREAGVNIIPVFMQNSEEMRFNPLFFICNKLRLSHAFQFAVDVRIPVLSWLLKQVGMGIWFCSAPLGVPVPVKLTVWIGEPVRVNKDDDVNDIAVRTRLAMESLIAHHQPHGHAYLPGIKERFAHLKKD